MKLKIIFLALAVAVIVTGCKPTNPPSVASPAATESEVPVASAPAPKRSLALPDAAALAVLADSLEDDLRVFSPPSSDRAFWTSTPLPAKEWIQKAEGFIARPIPELTEELYRDFQKTGQRASFQGPYSERLDRVSAFGLAEALENQGRFIAPLRESIQAILDEPSWVMSAHDFECRVFSGERMDVDLGASHRASVLATIICWHGQALGRETVERTQAEISRRVVEPFRKRIAGDTTVCSWANVDTNWNAVCLANTVYAALAAVPDKAVRAEVVGGAMSFINRFLDGFTMDGYCSEGIGYWEYGFGHFVLLAERLLLASGGKINLYQDPVIPRIVTNPARLELSSEVYPAFAAASPNPRVSPWFLTMLSRRFDMERPSGKMASIEIRRWTPLSELDMALAAPAAPEQRMALEPLSPLRGWFEVVGILVSRPTDPKKGLYAAMKGGHNAEHHNHNDLGSYVVTAGAGPVLLDPGADVFTKQTFSANRYDSKVLSSYGHSVPVVDGQLQATGRQAEAKVLKTLFTPARDEFALDLTSAYPVKGLNQLTRAFTYDRSDGTSLQVEDELHAERPMTFETALITYGTLERKQDGALNITNGANGGVRVSVETGGEPYEVTEEVIQANMVGTKLKPRRIAVRLVEPNSKAKINLTVTPLPKSAENEVLPTAGIPDAGWDSDGTVRIEAEDYTVEEQGSVERVGSASSGRTIRLWDNPGHALEWKVRIPREGRYLMVLRYANGRDGIASRSLLINGTLPSGAEEGFAFPPTGGWGLAPAEWHEAVLARKGKPFRINFAAGENTIRMVNTQGGGLNLDGMALIPLDRP
jgi:hypothetical protein